MRNKQKHVQGVGVNDYEGVVHFKNGNMYEYVIWSDVLRRCYSSKKQKETPTYSDCTVSSHFLKFTNFMKFVNGLIGFKSLDDNGKFFQLDKDLLVKGNKIYSEDTVCFIPKEINSFLTKSNKTRGKCLIGVSFHKQFEKFTAQVNINGRLKHLGCYDNEWSAFLAYKQAKENRAKELAEKWKGRVDPRVFESLINYSVEVDD